MIYPWMKCACCGDRLDNSLYDYCYYCVERKEAAARCAGTALAFMAMGGAKIDEDTFDGILDAFDYDCDDD